ncbi:MAG TPA: ATP-grasp domain-containing protein, partial [Methylomirabilota bacterium]|nr:ATP-grasp domain-containing protein [Methylomirabilota bacterium]
DRAAPAVTVIASAEGGVEIEETARTNPEAILRLPLHTLIGLQDHNIRRVSFFLDIPADLRPDFATTLRGLYDAFVASDADLAEINPLAVTDDGKLLALDAKIVLDDSALPRHPDLEAMRDLAEEEPSEIAAREAGISFIKLDGNIGCMVNGAGLAMTTMDLVKLAGGEPANFLDIGGGAKADRVAAAFKIILDDPNVKAILINIFGGITRGDEVARGIVEARAQLTRDVPMVVRIVGTNSEEAKPILAEANLITADSLDDAAAKAVAAARGTAA